LVFSRSGKCLGVGHTQESAVGWVIVAVIGVGVLIVVIVQVSKGKTATRLSAAGILSKVQSLQEANAQWNEILPKLNPSRDPEVQQLLLELRGPHLFAPHLALAIIEDGCKRVLASSPGADGVTALRMATGKAAPVMR
jgi:hypothetical protein